MTYRNLILLSIFLMCTTGQAFAERPSLNQSDGVTVEVLTIYGNGLRQPRGHVQVAVDKRISSLGSKLKKFQYQDYSLVGSKDTFVGLTSKKQIGLQDGHRLALRPLYIEGKRVGMWLRWQDAQGVKLLDTRMHFNCGVPVLTGTESGAESGVILAITVHPNK